MIRIVFCFLQIMFSSKHNNAASRRIQGFNRVYNDNIYILVLTIKNKTMERQKTAVEWLMEELNSLNKTQVEWHNAIKKALAIEREQIIEAATHFSGKMAYIDAPSPAEIYYTTKYSKQ